MQTYENDPIVILEECNLHIVGILGAVSGKVAFYCCGVVQGAGQEEGGQREAAVLRRERQGRAQAHEEAQVRYAQFREKTIPVSGPNKHRHLPLK